MDILTHHLSGRAAPKFDTDLQEAIGREANRVRSTAGSIVAVTLEQLRRWADQYGLEGPGRIAVFDGSGGSEQRGLQELTIANRNEAVSLGPNGDGQEESLSAGMTAWDALTTAFGLLLGNAGRRVWSLTSTRA